MKIWTIKGKLHRCSILPLFGQCATIFQFDNRQNISFGNIIILNLFLTKSHVGWHLVLSIHKSNNVVVHFKVWFVSASLYFLWWVECLPTWRQANQLKDFKREKAPRISFNTWGEKGNEKLWYGVKSAWGSKSGQRSRSGLLEVLVLGIFFTMCLEPQSGVGRNDDDDE